MHSLRIIQLLEAELFMDLNGNKQCRFQTELLEMNLMEQGTCAALVNALAEKFHHCMLKNKVRN